MHLRWKQWLLTILAVVVFSVPVSAMTTAAPAEQLIKHEEQIIGEGVTLERYTKVVGGKPSIVHVVRVDLTNPYAKIAPLYGTNGQLTKKQSVQGMVNEAGAIAGINADFFHTNRLGTPFGAVIRDKQIVSSMNFLHGYKTFGIQDDGRAYIGPLRFEGKIVREDGSTYPIRGVNKEIYFNGQSSHLNQIYLYNRSFGDRSLGPIPEHPQITEVVVADNTVEEIYINPQYPAIIPENGYVLWGHGLGANYLQTLKIGEKIDIQLAHFPDNLLSAVGSHALIADNGQPLAQISPEIKGYHARSAVGINQDGTEVILVAVEQNQKSQGMTMQQLAKLMVELGAYRAQNLDGGGSTTLAARYLGDETASLINVPKYIQQRNVPTAIGVFNTAEPSDEIQKLIPVMPATILLGQKVPLAFKAYDIHYLPAKPQPEEVSITVSEGDGAMEDGYFIAKQTGKIKLTAQYKNAAAAIEMSVLGKEQIGDITVAPNPLYLRPNDEIPLTIQIKTKDGKTIQADANSVKVTIDQTLGQLDGLTLKTAAEPAEGKLIVEYDGLQKEFAVTVGTKEVPWQTFDSAQVMYHTASPANISNMGNFRQTAAGEPVYATKKAARLLYNFTKVPAGQTAIAFGVIGKEPQKLPENAMGIGMWVYGDESHNILRAEVFDAKGVRYPITLAEDIDWTGWKYVKADFPYNLPQPLKLKSIYIVQLPEKRGTAKSQGIVYIDEISVFQPYRTEKESAMK